MKIFLISQEANNGYDTFDAAVVCAPDELTARNMNPGNGQPMTEATWQKSYSPWCSSLEQVRAQYLGEAEECAKQGVVLASYNAG